MATALEFTLRADCLPADALVTEFECTEALSSLYELEVTFTTEDTSFVADTCLRKGITLVIEGEGRTRAISGVCDLAEFTGVVDRTFHFRVRMRPPVAALSQREDNHIYQDKGLVAVIGEVFEAAGVDKVEWHLTSAYPPREFIVQYRETELDFVSRLLEDEGIFYFFEHADGEVTMVMGDGPEALKREAATPAVLTATPSAEATDGVRDLARTASLRSSNTRLRDYDFEKPQLPPNAAESASAAVELPYYEYPGAFTKGADGSRRATARLRELRHDVDVLRGSSHCFVLEVGALVTIEGARQESLNGRFVVTELRTHGKREKFSGTSIENSFSAIPEDQSWAPPRRAHKPRIAGLQTATVMGPTGEEQAIHVDKYGRVKVRFHWDRVGQKDDTASCWLRVMQVPLGGSIIVPRVSWEVSVAFLEGDPDRPFVLGRLYNGEKTPPYALPSTQTSGAIKSMSTPGAAGHNEINLGDAGGSQGFSTHAQKDMNTTIGHDKTEKVGVDEKQNVKVNRSTTVKADQTVSIGGNQTIDVGAVASQKIAGSQSISVGGNSTDDATANHVDKVGADRSYDVGGNMTVICNTVLHTIAGNLNRDVGAAMVGMSIASISDTIGGNYDEKVSLAHLALCKSSYNEAVAGSKKVTAAAADVLLVKGNCDQSCDACVTHLVGGLHYQKIAGDYSVSAPIIALIGAIGDLKGGGSNVKLGGGPVVITGSEVTIETALLVKMGASLKLG
jgi:type VI secretion system secreted protein VgrG